MSATSSVERPVLPPAESNCHPRPNLSRLVEGYRQFGTQFAQTVWYRDQSLAVEMLIGAGRQSYAAADLASAYEDFGNASTLIAAMPDRISASFSFCGKREHRWVVSKNNARKEALQGDLSAAVSQIVAERYPDHAILG